MIWPKQLVFIYCESSETNNQTFTIDVSDFLLPLKKVFHIKISFLGGLYSGGSAQMIEKSLNVHGDEILYVGDHVFTDVSQSKVHLRWRTALICRELEEEVSFIRSSLHRVVRGNRKR